MPIDEIARWRLAEGYRLSGSRIAQFRIVREAGLFNVRLTVIAGIESEYRHGFTYCDGQECPKWAHLTRQLVWEQPVRVGSLGPQQTAALYEGVVNICEFGEPTHVSRGYSAEFLQLLDRRNAHTHGAHLVPWLRTGLRLLDFGCGPGTVSVGLAAAVDPGEVHGIDMEESPIEMARSAGSSGGHRNAKFHVGIVYELHFEDNYFDVAHRHAVLMRVPDTNAALRKVKRVIKPGGIIASREMIAGPSFSEPAGENTSEAWATLTRLLAASRGHPEMGQELKRRLLEAGFTNIHATASFDYSSSADDVAFLHAFIMDWFFMPRVITAPTQYGLATHEQFDQWRAEMDEWKETPGAVGGQAFGEEIGTKP